MGVAGAKQIAARLRRQGAGAREAANQASYDLAEETLARSQPLVSRDKGELAASGEVQQDGEGWAVVYTAPHAAAVHERLDAHHTTGQAKYLEQPFLESIQRAPERHAERLRAQL